MAKATHAVTRVAAPRKSRAPFTLSAEARSFLKAHRECQAAEQAFRTAALKDEAGGRNVERSDYAPATCALRNKWRTAETQMAQMGDAIADRLTQKRKPALADCVLLALASWHSAKARAACGQALLGAAGIDLTATRR